MVLIAWTDKLAVNVKEIDDQHKKLINIINQLNDAMNSGKGRDVLGKVLTELVNYTMYHFGTEERLMEQHKYVNSPTHKAEHQKFVDTVGDFKKKFDSGNAMLSIKIMHFLRDWLTNHIMKTDQKFGQALNKLDVK